MHSRSDAPSSNPTHCILNCFFSLKNWRHFDFYEHFIKKFHIRQVKCLVRGGCQFGRWNQVTTCHYIKLAGPPFWKSVGTGPSSRPVLLPFRENFFCFSSGLLEILDSDLFQDNFSMALYSFGGVNDQCNVTSWAVQEARMQSIETPPVFFYLPVSSNTSQLKIGLAT